MSALHGRSSPSFAQGAKSSLSYSAPYIKALFDVYLVVRSGSGGRQTNSAAAPVWSYHDPPAYPEMSQKDVVKKIMLTDTHNHTNKTLAE